MGKPINESNNDISIYKNDKQEVTQSASKPIEGIKPWAKRIYRQIVMATHPDKTASIQSDHLKQHFTELYRITQNAYNKCIYSDLIMVAFDLNIDLPDGVVEKEITPDSNIKKKIIIDIKKLLGWQWYHVPDTQRDAELKKILVSYGFKFTDDAVKKVVNRKYVKRKVGTRPEKINVKRRKLK